MTISAARFAEIDAANPRVWVLFVRFSMEKIQRGFHHYSADAILHRVRWETDTPLDDGSGFKINDHWSAFYARKFLRHYPDHAEFFSTRKSIADKDAA